MIADRLRALAPARGDRVPGPGVADGDGVDDHAPRAEPFGRRPPRPAWSSPSEKTTTDRPPARSWSSKASRAASRPAPRSVPPGRTSPGRSDCERLDGRAEVPRQRAAEHPPAGERDDRHAVAPPRAPRAPTRLAADSTATPRRSGTASRGRHAPAHVDGEHDVMPRRQRRPVRPSPSAARPAPRPGRPRPTSQNAEPSRRRPPPLPQRRPVPQPPRAPHAATPPATGQQRARAAEEPEPFG